MIVGIPKEIKNSEYRVAITPAGVMSLVDNNHQVIIEKDAGIGSGFEDKDYIEAGASIVDNPKLVWDSDMVIKVKEPIASEYQYFRDGLILFTYLHLAPEKQLTKELINSGVISIAYETVQLNDGSLPLLTPMSEVAGRMAVQIGAQLLEKHTGGKGILLAGVPGVPRANVTIIGGGIVGTNAIAMALGIGARVTVLDVNLNRLRQLEEIFGNKLQTLVSNSYNITNSVAEADLVIGAVLLAGAKAPTLVTEKMVAKMKDGSVIVDVAIDQGGIFESIDCVTTHQEPTYTKHGVIHYAVANMPGAVPRTSTLALTNATLPYVLALANKGYEKACLEDEALLKGINTMKTHLTYKAVAEAQNLPFTNVKTLLTK